MITKTRLFLLCVLFWGTVSFENVFVARAAAMVLQQDTTEGELSSEELAKFNKQKLIVGTVDSIDVQELKKTPFTNLADLVKGNLAGVHVQQPSGEPGSYQNMVVRGVKNRLFSNTDINANRPAVFINGIPLTQDHSFAYEIQKYDINRIGPATDLWNTIDMRSVESIELIKDPIRLAEIGPLATNGVIWITTTGGKSGHREISIGAHTGINTTPAITPVNAHYENMFRQPFYAKYGDVEADLRYPGYLADSTNLNYYGPANWRDGYYKLAMSHNVNMGLRGGTDRANFGFYGAYTGDASSADQTGLDRYNALFNINMLPFKWFKISAFVNGIRTERNRNKNIRDRFAEMAYLPDLSTPISPSNNLYNNFVNRYDAAVDDNVTNTVRGGLDFQFDILPNLYFNSNFSIDYSEGIRDVFYPSDLMETINFVSNYFGYSQRYIFSNELGYDVDVDEDHTFQFKAGAKYQDDLYRFNYARAYDGPNDFIKINVVTGNASDANYLQPVGGVQVHRIMNREIYRMMSVFGRVGYRYKDFLSIDGLLRFDGSSNVQPSSRWLFTPAFSATWNIQNQMELNDPFSIRASYAKIGIPEWNSRFALGPQYAVQMGWQEEPSLVSYYGQAGFSRPYQTGWVGYGLDWAYTNQFDLTVDKEFLNGRVGASASLYLNEHNNQLTLIPIPEEYGYQGMYKNGMDVRNTGVDLTVRGQVLAEESALQWTPSIQLNFNKNQLMALPQGLKELQVGDRLLRVGEAVDKFWLLENQGIYAQESDIPLNPNTGARMDYQGVELSAGDPRWADLNGDHSIDKEDKVLTGNSMPKLFGGFSNKFTYKNFDLNIQLYFALGHQALNHRAANRYDFINNESGRTINAVREVFHWQQDVDIQKYPLYNPWSSVVPYRTDQDLFLENASFIKLRTLSFGYDFSDLPFLKENVKHLRKAYLYAMGNNLFTLSGFSGRDPELINVNGIYDGYGLPLAPTYTIGLKFDF